jgi:hypothetical protein
MDTTTDTARQEAYKLGYISWVRGYDRPEVGAHLADQQAGYDAADEDNEGGWRPDVSDAAIAAANYHPNRL